MAAVLPQSAKPIKNNLLTKTQWIALVAGTAVLLLTFVITYLTVVNLPLEMPFPKKVIYKGYVFKAQKQCLIIADTKNRIKLKELDLLPTGNSYNGYYIYRSSKSDLIHLRSLKPDRTGGQYFFKAYFR